MPNSCVVCQHSDHKTVFNEFGVAIVRCKKCGHVYSTHSLDQNHAAFWDQRLPTSPTELEFWFNQAHEAIYTDFGKQFLAGRHGRLLDLGCGLGYFLKFASRYPGWKLFGSEISEVGAEHARRTHPEATIQTGAFKAADFGTEGFDLITLWDVIEHIPDPQPLLLEITRALKPGGLLFIHTPNIQVQLPKARLKKTLWGMRDGSHYLEARDHMNIFTPRSMRRLLDRHGFSNIQYLHFRPVQSVAGSRRSGLIVVKNLWYFGAVALDRLSGGLLNFDNLSVAAQL